METLEKLGIRNPAALLSATIDALCETVDRLSAKRDSEQPDRTFYYRQFGEPFMPDDKFLALFRNALGTLAQSDATEAISLLKRLAPTAHPALLHLHLETIAANGAALGCALVPLLNEERLFEAGWANSSTSSFVAAARAARPHLDYAQWSLVERRILQHHPELGFASSVLSRKVNFGIPDKHEYALNLLSIAGEEVWTVLENIGDHCLSKEAQRRLEELRRKFVGHVLRRPEPMRARIGHSPVFHAAAFKMSDEDWLHAFDVYLTKPSQSPRLPISSPASNLASELLHVAQSEPARFAALLLRIDDKHPQAYIRSILQGLATATIKKRTKRIVRAALRSAHSRPGHPYGEAISAVVEKHPELGLDEDIFSFLSWYVKHGTSNDKEVQDADPKDGPVTIEQLFARSERLYFHALDGQRGAALRALRATLWHVKGNFPKAWPLLEELVSQEQDASVRVALVSCLAPMIHSDRLRCAELLKELVWKPCGLGGQPFPSSVHVLATNEATNLVAYLLRNEPASGRQLVDALLTDTDSDLRLLGEWHIIRASFYLDEYMGEADGYIRTNTDCARLAATCAAHAIKEGELTSRAMRTLSELLQSGDSDTLSNAGDVFRNVPPESFHKLTALARDYIVVTSLRDDAFPLLYGLEHATGDISELVVEAAEQLVANACKLERRRRRATDLQQIRTLLSREYAASENRPALRTRILDVLDTMLELDLFGAEVTLPR
ncbi:hypothetical protein C7408_1592 [Paraburkholderia caballeronis]|nr:hypothetical protein C7408_1592 [Paraburkholderia caballeronis]TDV05469.1 hypothetical protein C7406_1572 [Paraburkholderia caballeronis]TDV15323.1 hypothetical protein C7404_1592 [Paraburkholderia caballeronis]